MKGRLIANGIISLITSILFIVMIAMFVKAADNVTTYTSFNSYSDSTVKSVTVAVWIWVLLIPLYIASLVMGIVTLSMEKSSSAHGLSIASGVLAILGGCFFVGAIVSFIAAAKA